MHPALEVRETFKTQLIKIKRTSESHIIPNIILTLNEYCVTEQNNNNDENFQQ